jgi:hypothetical protein
LGTINAVRLSLDALDGVPTVVLNRFDPGDELHRANRRWLEAHCASPVVTGVGALLPDRPAQG